MPGKLEPADMRLPAGQTSQKAVRKLRWFRASMVTDQVVPYDAENMPFGGLAPEKIFSDPACRLKATILRSYPDWSPASTGWNSSVTVVPRPSLLEMSTRPPDSSIIFLIMAKPRP